MGAVPGPASAMHWWICSTSLSTGGMDSQFVHPRRKRAHCAEGRDRPTGASPTSAARPPSHSTPYLSSCGYHWSPAGLSSGSYSHPRSAAAITSSHSRRILHSSTKAAGCRWRVRWPAGKRALCTLSSSPSTFPPTPRDHCSNRRHDFAAAGAACGGRRFHTPFELLFETLELRPMRAEIERGGRLLCEAHVVGCCRWAGSRRGGAERCTRRDLERKVQAAAVAAPHHRENHREGGTSGGVV